MPHPMPQETWEKLRDAFITGASVRGKMLESLR